MLCQCLHGEEDPWLPELSSLDGLYLSHARPYVPCALAASSPGGPASEMVLG